MKAQRATQSCQPARCETCEIREQSPLCSVEDARVEIQMARTWVHFQTGQTIFYQGNEPLGLFVIQSGLVKLESITSDGASHTRRLLGPGQALGYRALFAGEKYQASAVTVEEGDFCFLPKTVLIGVIKRHPAVAMNLLQQLSRDLRTAEEKWVTQVDKGAPERVAEALIFLNEQFKDQAWTRREIAQWAGTTPETVIRTLATFEKQGLIEPKGKLLKILDLRKLSEKAQGT